MKYRLKIDGVILASVVMSTIILWMYEDLYPDRKGADIILDCIGLVSILKGSLLRMSARGHKKSRSRESQSLVMTGPYSLVRNPMYLGSFFIGAGFTLLLWPWWLVPVFAGLFYVRFNRQVMAEETFLSRNFPHDYPKYAKKVPRLFPTYERIKYVKVPEIINIQEALSTHEARGIFVWPLLAFVLESVQELIVFGMTDPGKTLIVFVVTSVVFFAGLWMSLNKT